MYHVFKKTLTSLTATQILTCATEFEDVFAFESADKKTRFFGLQAWAQKVPTQLDTAMPTIEAWYQALAKNIPTAYRQALKVVGGFAFEQQHTTQKNIWGDFKYGRFFLPKYTLIQTKPKAYDLLVLAETEALAQQQAEALTQQLLTTTPMTPNTNRCQRQVELGVAQWQQAVAASVARLKNNELQKVVMARPLQLQSDQTFVGEQAWLQLCQQNPETYHILYRHQEQAFISATPERLIQFDQTTFHTVAIAGTCPTAATPKETQRLGAALLKDPKNRQEQNFVTQTIVQNLQELGITVHYSDVPELLVNKNVQHLKTPIWGDLTQHIAPFALIQALHPTPALGGVPKKLAQQIISETEPLARGLFGGPIGYLDFTQRGEFVVGIRSALLHRQTATLFAGAGIVKDSDPSQEVRETRLKFSPMRQTLLSKEAATL